MNLPSRRALALAVVLAVAPTGSSRAEVPAADEAAAQRRFGEGEKAFKKGDFLAAGAAFDEANRLAPHPASLWNAAKAWHRAGEHAKAANLYRRYLRVAPTDAADWGSATTALAELMQKLARIDVLAPDGATVRIDKTPLEGAGLVVNPGSHALEAELGDKSERRVVEIGAGSVLSITVLQTEPPAASAKEPPAPQPPPPSATAPPLPPLAPPPAPPAAQPAAPEVPRRPLPPWSLAIGTSVTAVLAGFTIGLGVDVLSKRDAYDAAPSQALFDAGRDAQLATNALLGKTLGAATLTVVLAAFATDWGPSARSPERRLGDERPKKSAPPWWPATR